MKTIIFTTLIILLFMTDNTLSQNKSMHWEIEIIIYDWETLHTHTELKKQLLREKKDKKMLPYLEEMIADLDAIIEEKRWKSSDYIEHMIEVDFADTSEEISEELREDALMTRKILVSCRNNLINEKKIEIDEKTSLLELYLNWKNPLIFQNVWFYLYNKVFFTYEFWEEIYKKVPEIQAIMASFTDLYDITEDLYYPGIEMLNQFQTINEKGVKQLAPQILAIKESNYPKELEILQKIFRLAQEGKGRIFILHG